MYFVPFLFLKTMKHLSTADRDFLSRVYKSSLLNPFSAERFSSDAYAIGKSEKVNNFAFLGELLTKLDKCLKETIENCGATLNDYSTDDAVLLEISLLFRAIHYHRTEIDKFITAQICDSLNILQATWANSIYTELRSFGIPSERSENYIAIIFQMRRAFHFITNSLIGNCDSMKKLRVELWNSVFTCNIRFYFDKLLNKLEDYSTLLLGETGTGKGVAAAALGRSCFIPYQSRRQVFSESFTQAFQSINLSEFSESLIESELFGHKKGAFTGAISDHNGIFSRCSPRGAIFLDEIGDTSLSVQIKLLRVLQQRTFSPVGGHEQLRFNGRVIAATNKDITTLRESSKFRDDFYYRLSSSKIELPPLRLRLCENPSEINLLLLKTVERLTGEENHELAARIEEIVTKELPPDYSWPGNVRELEQAARSIILSGHYSGEIQKPLFNPEIGKIITGSLTLDELTSWYCTHLYKKLGTYGAVAELLKIDRRTVKEKISQ